MTDPFDPTAAVAMVREYLSTVQPRLDTTDLGDFDGIFAMRFSYEFGDVYALQTTEHIPWTDARWTAARALFLPDSVLSLGPQPIGNACVRVLLWATQPLTLIDKRR
jgi:hypothetical protein